MFDWDPRIGALMHREPVLAKVVAAPAGPADAQVKGSDGWTVNDRESPSVTALTGTWRV